MQHCKTTTPMLDAELPSASTSLRKWEGQKWLIALNFSTASTVYDCGDIVPDTGKAIIGNYATPPVSNQLRGYEAVVYQL